MELKLKNILMNSGEKPLIRISFEITYGWKGEMYHEVVRLNYNQDKKKVYLIVEAENPGIGFVIERMIDAIGAIDSDNETMKHYPLSIIEKLSEKFNMEYDHDLVKRSFPDFW